MLGVLGLVLGQAEGEPLARDSSKLVALMPDDVDAPQDRSSFIRDKYNEYHRQRTEIERTLRGRTGTPDMDGLAYARRLVGDDKSLSDGRKGELTSVIDKVEAEHRLKEKILAMRGKKGCPDFNPAKFDQLYRMFIDRSHVEGESGDMQFYFENERGYLAGVMNGFTQMMDSLGTETTADSFMSLHDTCMHGVHDRKSGNALDKGYRDQNHGTGYPIAVGEDGNFSAEGLNELKKKAASDGWHEFVVLDDPDDPGSARLTAKPGNHDHVVHLQCTRQTAEACKKKIEGVFNDFNAKIKHAGNKDAKLFLIAKCCQDLDQAHAFADGNVRVIAFVLLNKLLMENGLAPSILREPNRFDGYSVDELVADIKEGQDHFGDAML